jgi:hypothetical protein
MAIDSFERTLAEHAFFGDLSPSHLDGLRAWIREHRVCWELAPRFEVHDHRRIQVGFDLTLLARHPASLRDEPGCEECYRHYETLREIAQIVLPKGIHPTRCEFTPFDAAYHLRPETQWAPEIELTVEITHRDATFGDVDDDERRCAAEIEEGLRRLGARPRVWSTAESFNAGR